MKKGRRGISPSLYLWEKPMDMPSLFSRIISGEIPSHKIAEDDRFYAFLDISPLRMGHTLVVPKRETDYIFQLPDEELSALLLFAQPIARAIEQAFPCKRCGLAVIGLEVPHAHLHIVPIDSADDLNFTRPKLNPSAVELEDAKKKILSKLL